MKAWLPLFLVLNISGTAYAQNNGHVQRAYKAFAQTDWNRWNSFDTVQCTINRTSYLSHLDNLLVVGISRDTVEKYLGKGQHIKYVYTWHGKVQATYAKQEKYLYPITWDCPNHGRSRELWITYRGGKLVSFRKNSVVYY